ncbi:uncharacterized protein LOC129767205 isoform X2 [Toxorhynchites rutilus septentrionalis]|uniref:uncharacterized protein LOC129767205 isoform X2 n=1 Tax=Toxorhynchites rutilus septentrionalis TaxID=329112 RepID=UPI002478BFA3|nr:uncharacterized protein LOC129767205 isoform X2 [Toxorhynchites rutilus septentrionalis]
MNLHKLSKRHSLQSMQQPARQPPDELSRAPADVPDGGAVAGACAKQRKKGKFRLKERSSSSVRERFMNDPAYTEDVRHLALPMRRNSGPENAETAARKFYTIPKKKSNSVGKDYLRSASGSRALESQDFYSVDAEDASRQVTGGGECGTNAPESVQSQAAPHLQVKVRRKKFNYHNSSEALRLNDESSSSDNLKHSKSSTLDRRGRSLDRRSTTAVGGSNEYEGAERERCVERDKERTSEKRCVSAVEQAAEDRDEAQIEKTRGRNRNLIRRQNAAEYEGAVSLEEGSCETPQQQEGIYKKDELEGHSGRGGGGVAEDTKESKSKFQIGKRFLKGEIGIKSFNYYLLKEGLKSSKKNFLKQRSAPAEAGGDDGGLERGEENIYEEIYFDEKPAEANDEKIQFIDCELCVQQCSNSNCEACHSHVSRHKLQLHHHHQQQKQLEKQNVYEQLKQVPPQIPASGTQYKAVASNDADEVNLYQSSSSTYSTGTGNVLQYQSYNPNNPNVFKIETTPVAFSCDYNPIQPVYYKMHRGPPGAPNMSSQQRHIYQQAHNIYSASSDYYQEIRKKSSSSSDSLQARMQRELYQQASLYYYQRRAAAGSRYPEPTDSSEIYKTSSNASILSEMSVKSESSLKQPRTGNMSDSSLGDSLFSHSANRRYFGSSESCRFASDCRRCSMDVEKCSFSDNCRYDCRNCDCSSSYFSSDFDDVGMTRKNSSRQSGNNIIQDNYSVPAYAEDFIKHVNNVKRNQLCQPTTQQQQKTAGGKIYETPTTYAGMSKKTAPQQLVDHQYETVKSNSYRSGGGGQPPKAMQKYDENTKLSVSHSHELLLSPTRSKLPLEGRYSLGAVKRYGPKFSSTLPASISGGRTRYTDLPEGGTLPKSLTGPPKATLSKLNHEYAEIVALPTTKPSQQMEPSLAKRASVKYTAPQPPNVTSGSGRIPTRRPAPPIPLNPPLTISDESDPKSITSGGAWQTSQPPAPPPSSVTTRAANNTTTGRTPSPDKDKSLLPRKERVEPEGSYEQGATGSVVTSSHHQDVAVPTKRTKDKSPLRQPPARKEGQLQVQRTVDRSQQQQHKDKQLQPGNDPTKRQQQHQPRQHKPVQEEEDNLTDDEDDEVFLSDKLYATPKQDNRRVNPPPKEQTATNKAPPAAAQATGSANSSSQVSAAQQPSSTEMSNQREPQPEPEMEEALLLSLSMMITGGAAPQKDPNESESLRTLHTPTRGAESVSDLVRKSDEPVPESGAGGVGVVSPRIKTKSPAEELSTDLAVSGATAEPASGRLAAVVVFSNRQERRSPTPESTSPSRAIPSKEQTHTVTHKSPQKDSKQEPQTGITETGGEVSRCSRQTAAALGNVNQIKLITNDECDIGDFPLPEIPVKQDPTSSDNSFLTATDNDTTGEDGKSPLLTKADEQKNKPENREEQKQTEAQEMHYRNSNDKPTYLFGENLKKNEIFLNKSGWVQVSQPPLHPSERSARAKYYQSEQAGPKTSRKFIEYDENRYDKGSKLEDLINRNEVRRNQYQKIQRQDNVTILKIEPQLSFGGRPVCLPIKRNLADNSPPPVTPILSPPPAFQDSKYKTRLSEIKPGTRIFLSVVDNDNRNPRGMVFSRSFEYDNRRHTTPVANVPQHLHKQSYSDFSKSFDFEIKHQAAMPKTTDQPFIRRNRSPTFSTLTGNSPNYLTKKEKASNPSIVKDHSPIFPKSIPGSSLTSSGYESLKRFGDKTKSLESQMMSSSAAAAASAHRSRRSQFSTKANSTPGIPTYGYRSDSIGNTRLNSCDSGARSDYSNDGAEDDEDVDVSEDQSSSLALSYKSSTSYMNQMKGRSLFVSSGSGNSLTAHSVLKPQRSLTPERLYDNDDYGSMRNLKKQRSLTPEKRSRTPDDRSKGRKGEMNSSQSSLVSRLSSGSRSSTLERRYDDSYTRGSSRSSSSSSYSGDENHIASYRRGQIRAPSLRPSNAIGDYRIRRSRSLQLSERSPNRQPVPVGQPHKVVVRLGNVPKERPVYAAATRKLTGSQLLAQDSHKTAYRISPNNTLDRLRRETASHTIDVDKSKSFENNNYGTYEYDFDKSKSFDENYILEGEKRPYVNPEVRSYSHDRVLGSTGTSSSNEYSHSSASRNRSPQTYGSRLFEHDLQYDVNRSMMNRSPIVNYNQRRGIVARERSPIPGASKTTLMHYQRPSDPYLLRNLTPDSEFDDRATPDFVDDPPTSSAAISAAAFKEAELVKKFLYATKNKQLQRESRNLVVPPAGTPTSGSCTASSCDFWPHCGVTSSLTVERLTKSGSENCLNRRNIGCDIANTGTGSEVIVIGGKIGVSGSTNTNGKNATLVPVKANSYGGVGHHPLKKQKNIEINDRDLPFVLGGYTGPRYFHGAANPAIVKANSVAFLGEHEMPITRDRVSKAPSQTGVSSTSVAIAKQDSLSSRVHQSSTGPRTTKAGQGIGGDRGSGGGSSNSSVKSNSSNYKVNRSPSNRSSSSGSQRQMSIQGIGTSGANTAGLMTTMADKTGSGNEARDRKSRPFSTRPRSTAAIKRKFEMKLKSRSLPKSFMRYSNLSSDDLELSAILSANSPLQLKAVSSPSLTEPTPPTAGPAEHNASNNHSSTDDARTADASVTNQLQQKTALAKPGQTSHHPQQASESVLQKFKKTFSHLKSTKAGGPSQSTTHQNQTTGSIAASNNSSSTSSTNPNAPPTATQRLGATMSMDSGTSQKKQAGSSPQQQQQHQQQQQQQSHHHHRFGPLIWRSSKERRKTKSHRRDKCNSGDSGIQVELEADEQLLQEGIDAADTTSSPQANISVRRANSAKVSTGTSLLKHKLSLKSNNKENVANISRLSTKSLSQPSGLDCIASEKLRPADPSDSDSDDTAQNDNHLLEEPVFAEVLFSFRPAGPQELALEKGALVEVLKRESGPWWWGRIKSDAILSGRDEEEDRLDSSDCGWFPMDFVKLLPTYNKPKQIIIINNQGREDDGAAGSGLKEDELKSCDILQDTTTTTMPTEEEDGSGPNLAGDSSQKQTQENVIKELLETEINYVKLLNSLCLGYIKSMREREDIFPVESVNIIFSNLEKIWRFQQTFLDALRMAVPNNMIGEVFLEYQSAFMIYSSYCNSYPRALMELENYANNKEASAILDSCRMEQNLPELPLSAHLLAPIQRICRYPLHLSELVKHSPTRKELLALLNPRNCTKAELETMDCQEVFELALTAMRRVTEMVNEGKRHSEYLSRIQSRFENFQGPSINVHSTRLFLQTDAIRMSPNLWNNTYTLFLFDRQLIYCKKDLLKRTSYIYKGRIFLDNCRILNLPDGKMFGVTLKNALRLYCDTRNKWFDFCFRSSSSKLRFLNTLSAERQFCGESLFVSELDGAVVDDDNLSDREYFPFADEKDGCSNTDTETSNDRRGVDLTDSMQFLLGNMSQSTRSSSSNVLKESPTNVGGKQSGNTLPKKSRKSSKDQQQQQHLQLQPTDYSSHSLGRRKLGNWFRKAKSTNSTPSQSPTHHPMALSLAAVNNASDSSSASSPGLGYQQRTLSAAVSTNGTPAAKGKLKDSVMTQSSTS